MKLLPESLNGIFWQGNGPGVPYATVLGEPNSGYCYSKTKDGISASQQSCKDKAFTGCKKEVLGGKVKTLVMMVVFEIMYFRKMLY